ncbi:MAG: nucleotidyl transferase AbiEii/AbiGii toxin family protein [Treponema sp.]|nr:nucleotidyl transferase AbiEii/AbiGii toxin family protein [Treponema sp.]
MYLHQNKELFAELLTQTAESSIYSEEIIEKDYYVFLLLMKIKELNSNVVFKGGTSLSKCFGIIERFSEDIDLTFIEDVKKSKRSKQIKHNLIEKISNHYDFQISNFDENQGDWNVQKYHFKTPVVSSSYQASNIDPKVTIELSFLSPCENPEKKEVDCYILKYIRENKLDIWDKYNIDYIDKFEMNVQPMQMTYIDKVYALCDYFLDPNKNPDKCSRHLYDIHQMTPSIIFNSDFEKMIKKIRAHRTSLEKAYSTKTNQTKTIKDIVSEFSLNDYYKDDYNKKTKKLIGNKNITYEMTIDNINKIVSEDIF